MSAPYYSQRAQCLRLSKRFFILFLLVIVQWVETGHDSVRMHDCRLVYLKAKTSAQWEEHLVIRSLVWANIPYSLNIIFTLLL